jgi:hypothetical protein
MATNQTIDVGTKLAIVSFRGERRISGPVTVAKVHKNGNFTIEGSNQQYKPSVGYDGKLYANRTGVDRYVSDHQHLEVWTEETDAEIATKRANKQLTQRLEVISKLFDAAYKYDYNRTDITTVLDGIEATEWFKKMTSTRNPD